MGWDLFPVYGKDVGSAIETAEKIIAKIKTNKFDETDLQDLDIVLTEIRNAVKKD